MTQVSATGNSNGTASSSMLAQDQIHVEVRLRPQSSTVKDEEIAAAATIFIQRNHAVITSDSDLTGWQGVPVLAQHVDKIRVSESTSGETLVRIDECQLHVHTYQPAAVDVVEDFSAGDPGAEDEEDVMAATVVELPSRSLEGVWDSLVYADDVKMRLLNYIHSTLLFSDANVDFNVVSWNRVVLLHGPPGTGKTSLCKALAQKLAIRLSHRYAYGKLVEINSHSLFSKWFSESGKLVQRLFSLVTEMVEDEDAFVVILIDEVESLTAARSAAASGTEPSDAVRVVNALLTQLDKLKHRKNVLVMTTSNISESIDTAFVDRADIRQYIGLPPPKAVYWILATCMKELMRVGMVESEALVDWNEVEKVDTQASQASRRLYELATMCEGVSGRTLRKLPVLAHARYIGMAQMPVPYAVWFEAMRRALLDSQAENAHALKGGGV